MVMMIARAPAGIALMKVLPTQSGFSEISWL
jgi:hypothetical protein